jgi:hypothetical protein
MRVAGASVWRLREGAVRYAFGRLGLVTALVALYAATSFPHAHAQVASPSDQSSESPRVYRTVGARVAIGRSIHVAADEEVNDAVVVVGGSLRVDGRVRDGIVVVGGNVELGPQSDVRGDVVLVGGRLTRTAGSQLRGTVSDVSFGNWGSWNFGGVSIPTVHFGDFGRWMTLVGAVFRVSVLAVLMAMMLLVARAPVARVGRAAGAEPIRAFVVGLVAAVLFLPAVIVASIGLIVTIIGIPLVALFVPVAFFAAFTALILGFTGIACRLGEWVEDRVGWRGNSAFLATAVGLMLIVGPTMLARFVGVAPAPLQLAAMGLLISGLVLEFVVWTTGLGATLLTGFGRWSTAPPPVPPVSQSHAIPVAS